MNSNLNGLFVLLICVFASLALFVALILFAPNMELAQFYKEGETSFSPDETKPVDISGVKEPWIYSELMVAHGKQVYQTYCASCHGSSGKGDGIAGKSLIPPPRNLITGAWRKGGSSIALYTTLLKGIEGSSMVSFAYLSKEDRWALVQYVRSITQDKTEDNIEELTEFAKTAQ